MLTLRRGRELRPHQIGRRQTALPQLRSTRIVLLAGRGAGTVSRFGPVHRLSSFHQFQSTHSIKPSASARGTNHSASAWNSSVTVTMPLCISRCGEAVFPLRRGAPYPVDVFFNKGGVGSS